jgi:hypothetical protein
VAKAVLKIDENGGITGFPSAIFFSHQSDSKENCEHQSDSGNQTK